jgi:hypothetical protein
VTHLPHAQGDLLGDQALVFDDEDACNGNPGLLARGKVIEMRAPGPASTASTPPI